MRNKIKFPTKKVNISIQPEFFPPKKLKKEKFQSSFPTKKQNLSDIFQNQFIDEIIILSLSAQLKSHFLLNSMDRRKSLQMLMFDSDSDDIWHANVTKAVIAHVTLLKACHDANRSSVRKRRRRNRRPLAVVGPTGTGYDSCVISDAGTSFKAKNKNRKKKKSLSPQPNNPPATESLGILGIY